MSKGHNTSQEIANMNVDWNRGLEIANMNHDWNRCLDYVQQLMGRLSYKRHQKHLISAFFVILYAIGICLSSERAHLHRKRMKNLNPIRKYDKNKEGGVEGGGLKPIIDQRVDS